MLLLLSCLLMGAAGWNAGSNWRIWVCILLGYFAGWAGALDVTL